MQLTHRIRNELVELAGNCSGFRELDQVLSIREDALARQAVDIDLGAPQETVAHQHEEWLKRLDAVLADAPKDVFNPKSIGNPFFQPKFIRINVDEWDNDTLHPVARFEGEPPRICKAYSTNASINLPEAHYIVQGLCKINRERLENSKKREELMNLVIDVVYECSTDTKLKSVWPESKKLFQMRDGATPNEPFMLDKEQLETAFKVLGIEGEDRAKGQ